MKAQELSVIGALVALARFVENERRMRASSLVGLGVMAIVAIGCNSIKYPERLTCGPSGECPPGQTCDQGFCHSPGSATAGNGGGGGTTGVGGRGGANLDGGMDAPVTDG